MSILRALILLAFVSLSHSSQAEAIHGGRNATKKLEWPSPDGRFGFRSTGSEEDGQSYQLVSRSSGKILARVAESDPDPGPSARFIMKVQWRLDSKAFALQATLWKRGSYVAVYSRIGSTFREVKLPELEAEIPDRVKGGKEYPHIVELNSQSPRRWQKDGSLVVGIENIQDGGGDGSIRANRTVVLRLGESEHAKVVKSTIKFTKGIDE